MKKHILFPVVTLLGFIFFANQQSFGQFERMDIKYTIDTVESENNVSYNVNVEVIGQTGMVTYSLYKEKPLPENLLIKSDKTFDNTFQFSKISPGKYFVVVFENDDKAGFETILIGKLKSSQQ